ncbi:MAG TPA: LysM peptidoglycan-binding domain-containing protein [Opitutaceae bacterium]|nr:LysM peptidoglycan-binding domain-containing protein [Opitutaceae bacterium]
MKLTRVLWAVGFGAVLSAAQAQTNPEPMDIVNLREDVRLLTQRVGDLQIRVEQLERENSALRSQTGNAAQTYATIAQLNDTVAELNRTIKASAATTKSETLEQVSAQMEKLAKETNAALADLAKGQATRANVQTSFSDDYPKEGVSYTVQKGDTLSSIAKKTNANVRDIVNANKISDPTRLMVGQSLFIPQAQAQKN